MLTGRRSRPRIRQKVPKEHDAMPRKKSSPQRADRAAEYVDSPLMKSRIRYRRQLSVRIDGKFGAYRTRLNLARNAGASCTCPSEESPCKHVRALRKTWHANPGSFFDLERFLDQLSSRPKASLVAAIADLALARPECLGVLGVPGFDSDTDGEPWNDAALPEVEPETASGAGSRSTPVPARSWTTRQGQYLAFIYHYTKIHARAPAEADLQRHFGVTPPTVHQMLLTLHARGLIEREPGKARSVRLLVSRDDLPDLE